MYQWDGAVWQPRQTAVAPPMPAPMYGMPMPMAYPMQIRLFAADVESGQLPGVCIVTGQPTDARLTRRFGTVHPLALVGLVIGLLGVLITMFLIQTRIKGSVPLNAALVARWHGRRKLSWIFMALAVGLMVLAIAIGRSGYGTSETLLGVIGIWSVLGSLLLLILTPICFLSAERAAGFKWKVIEDSYSGKALQVENAHPAFVAALHAWHAQRMPTSPVGYIAPQLPTPPVAPAV